MSVEQREANLARYKEQVKGMWTGRLTEREQAALALVHDHYGLDPLLKEIVVLGGNLYVTKPGLNKVAYRDEKPPISIQMYPLDNLEREAIGLTQNDPKDIHTYQHAFKCLLWKKDTPTELPFTEFGIASWGDVGLHEKTKGHKTLGDMARTRAFCRVIRIAYRIGLPSLEETNIVPSQSTNVGPDLEPEHITEKQRGRLFALCHQVKKEAIKLKEYLKNKYNLDSTKDIPPFLYDDICEWIMEAKPDTDPEPGPTGPAPIEGNAKTEPAAESDEQNDILPDRERYDGQEA